jgi:hypothetical protein
MQHESGETRGAVPALLEDAFRRALATRPGGAAAPVVVVTGGVLGAGASTVAGLMALAAAGMQRTTLLIDAAHDGSPFPKLFDLRAGGVSVDVGSGSAGMLVRAADDLYLLRAPSHGARPGGPLAARFDLIIVDAGWRAEAALDACSAGADRVLVVVTPGHAPISAGYALVKVVERRFPGTRFEVVVNRRGPESAASLFEHLQTAALTFLNRAIALAALLPDDACLHAGTRGGMTLHDAAAGSAVADAIDVLTSSKLTEFDRARGAAGSLYLTRGA